MLTRLDGVRSAVVLVWKVAGSDALVAYCTISGTSAPGPADVRTHMAGVLPEYMVPSEAIIVDHFAFGPNGKADTSRLAAPGQSAGRSLAGAQPTGAIETLIAEVWSEVLGLEQISPHDDFFALGGHSLMAIRVVGRLKKRMKLTIPMTAVFEHPKLRSLAQHVENEIRAQMAARLEAG